MPAIAKEKLAQLKRDTTEERLAGMTAPMGAGWASEARAAAQARVRDMGLPHPRDEYWKFTRPETLVEADAPHAALFDGGEPHLFHDRARLHLVFRDGVLDEAASDALALDGIEIERLGKALDTDIHWARDTYGVLEEAGQSPVPRPLAALNTAYATDGVVIRVTGTP